MPITCPIALQPISQHEFAKTDYTIMRLAFDSLNALDGAEDYERHLKSLLWQSPLHSIYWINVARHRIQFVTLHK